ncbi:uncharacterized protein AB675_11775 [Cyphellophora attinorum]|uniref:F-box domain-containing protein n=1 Tax=Cyphellophora attinorum TaxID=1664694 RepID=A0A0N1NXD2_9EURO|nr:uncharacterized protein AB675_11775 [Phialophora attinorum]KPI36823.1 hypothetical protein AB675_11775 [Phialophora attinorum]
MSPTLSAPPWVKPEPNLCSMPTEILEKIIGFAMPDSPSLGVTAWYRVRSWGSNRETDVWEQGYPFYWHPSQRWVPGLLLVSKAIRRVTRETLAYRTDFKVFALPTYVNFVHKVPTELKEKVKRYFDELLTRDEEHGLPARATL